MFKNISLNLSIINQFVFLLLVLFPIFLISGNLLINIFYTSIAIFSFFNIKKDDSFFKSGIFFLLVFFLVCLTINLIFSINLINSFPRFIKFLLIVLFIKEIHRFVNLNEVYFQKILKFWVYIFFVVTIDIIFEIIFGFNILGFKSPLQGRISSFFGDELVVGSFYHFFSLLVVSYFIDKKFQNSIIVILVVTIIVISFMIGERANFFKLFFSIALILFFILKINLVKKIGIIFLISSLITAITFFDNDLKNRYYGQISKIYSIDSFKEYFQGSLYGAHQNAAYRIFENNIFFGVGLKNFRDESKKDIYKNIEYKRTHERQATHPHQIHLELLAETGLIGYFSFLVLILSSLYISFRNYLLSRNVYQLSTIIFVVSCLIPLIPSGSLFSTFFGGIFWFNFGLMVSFNKNLNFKF